MSYEKITWKDRDVITADKLNHIEDGVGTSSQLLPTPQSEDVGKVLTVDELGRTSWAAAKSDVEYPRIHWEGSSSKQVNAQAARGVFVDYLDGNLIGINTCVIPMYEEVDIRFIPTGGTSGSTTSYLFRMTVIDANQSLSFETSDNVSAEYDSKGGQWTLTIASETYPVPRPMRPYATISIHTA